MGNSNVHPKLTNEELESIEKETGFNRNQIQRLHKRFNQLDKGRKGYLDITDFMKITELALNPLGDRLVDAFFIESVGYPDQNYRDYSQLDEGARISFQQFARVLAYFQPLPDEDHSEGQQDRLNNRLNKLRFAFSMYDLNRNNYVTREEFKLILNKMIGSNINNEQLECIVDRTMTEGDLNKDGQISFSEFCRAMDQLDIGNKMSIRFDN